jgi:murein DD-endopeptidase MepM/ murein hydrolase activator NlpD
LKTFQYNKKKSNGFARMFKRQILTDCMNPTHQNRGRAWASLLGTTRKARLMSASAIFLGACAFGAAGVVPLAPDAADLPVKSIETDLELPDLKDQIAALQQNEQTFVHSERIRAGDTLGGVLTRLGVNDADAVAFIKSDRKARQLMQLRTGKRIQAQTGADGQLLWLRASVFDSSDTPTKQVAVTRKGERLVAEEQPVKLERRIEMRSRQITSGSLYSATDAATDGSRLPDSVVVQLIEMFSNAIDFRSDLKAGDRFNVVYETYWQDGELVRTGRVLAGEFVNRGLLFQSVWYEDPVTKQSGYYSLDGRAQKKGFLKSPLQFSRISSGFSNRVHPISGQWKAHKGIDFAAAHGTPVKAAGDGTIDFAGVQGGYGNFIIVKHWSGYSTAYGHLSRFASGMRRGAKVKQGDVIGYVGSTGWSTGPHLHYEFRVNNQQRDPTKLKDIAQQPLTASEKVRFTSMAAEMHHRFQLLRPGANMQLAAR